MSSPDANFSSRVRRHVAAFNHAVATGRFEDFVARFTEDAVMVFVGAPVGPFSGREAILAGYEAAPPDDTMSVLSSASRGATDTVRFRWSRGGTGTMTLQWRGGNVAALEVAFDSA